VRNDQHPLARQRVEAQLVCIDRVVDLTFHRAILPR
jgi:hypothetical protein